MIRAATIADLAALSDIEQASFGDAWTTALLAMELTAATRIVLVDDGLRGYATAAVVDDVADLMRIAVLPEARRTGLGSALQDAIIERVRSAGAQRILLEVAEDNDAALAFYRGSGWSEIGRRERYYPDGRDALVMERRLLS